MKGFLKVALFSLLVFGGVVFAQNAPSPMASEPAYAQMKKMMGGVWHTKVDKTDVESRWSYGPDGTSMLGETIIDPQGKTPFHLNARFGWDDAAKQIYYLDAHGLSTVYFGHVSQDGNDLVMTFKGIVGDPNDYVFRIAFDNDDAFHATLYSVKDGKQDKVVEQFAWTRTKA